MYYFMWKNYIFVILLCNVSSVWCLCEQQTMRQRTTTHTRTCRYLSKVLGLTCRLGSELVPVGSTHCQQPIAQVQVKALLSSYATHHLEEEWIMSTAAVAQAFHLEQPHHFITLSLKSADQIGNTFRTHCKTLNS